MPAQDDIEQQRQLLLAYRRNLAHELGRAAQYGGEIRAPVEVANGIAQARVEIAQVKVTLRSWSVVIEDLPGDADPRVASAGAQTVRSRPWFWSISQQRDTIPDPEYERRNRQTLIADMRLRIRERLDSAPKLIPLRLAERVGVVEPPGALMRPYDLMRRQPGQPDQLLPARTKIADLYAEHNRQLLILGAPGAGKTFLLHELARDLVNEAARDETAPIPVIFSLASWQPGQAIDAWLIADLARRFGTKPGLFARLLRVGALLPLLDGLDEVATPELRIQCVAAINAFRQSQDLLPPLVVTCREREYADLPSLQVNAAIAVQPLALAQIDRYLAGPTFEALRAALRSDPQLADVARTPLLLGLMAAIYRNHAPQLPAGGDAAALHTIILGDYIDQCLVSASDPHTLRVSPLQLRAFLGWLACELTAHDNQQDFYLEFLQPDWLPLRAWHWAWRGARWLAGMLLGGLVGGLGGALLGGLGGALLGGLVGGLCFGLLGALLGDLGGGSVDIAPVETLRWSSMRFATKVRGYVRRGLRGGLLFGLVFGLVLGPLGVLLSGLGNGIFFGLMGGLMSGLIGGLVNVQLGSLSVRIVDIAPIEALRWSSMGFATQIQGNVRGRLRGMLLFGLVFALLGGLGGGIFFGLLGGLMSGLGGELFFGLMSGLAGGLLGGLTGSLLGGLSAGLKKGLLAQRTTVNQGMSRSLRSAIAGGVIWGSGIGLVFGLGGGLAGGLAGGPDKGLVFGLGEGLVCGLAIGLRTYGGSEVSKHYVLRLLLPLCTPAPLNFARWLEEARMRGLLVRVGGGYRFYHELLQRHFATNAAPGISRVPILDESEHARELGG